MKKVLILLVAVVFTFGIQSCKQAPKEETTTEEVVEEVVVEEEVVADTVEAVMEDSMEVGDEHEGHNH